MRAPNDCTRCPHLKRTEMDTTKVRRTPTGAQHEQ